MIGRENAYLLKISCQHRVLFKKFTRSDNASICASLLIDQKLRDECFKTGKMVKQKNIALLNLSVGMELHFDTEHFFDGIENPY